MLHAGPYTSCAVPRADLNGYSDIGPVAASRCRDAIRSSRPTADGVPPMMPELTDSLIRSTTPAASSLMTGDGWSTPLPTIHSHSASASSGPAPVVVFVGSSGLVPLQVRSLG